jgi:hypothetical protein
MPYYMVTYKTDADEDGEIWPLLGPIPDAHVALAIFNNTYAREKIGPFTFWNCSHVSDYYLVEQRQLNLPVLKRSALHTLPRPAAIRVIKG